MTARHDDQEQELADRQAWADAVAEVATRPLTPREQAEVDRATREAMRYLREQERKAGRR
jgi:hypothetical protein